MNQTRTVAIDIDDTLSQTAHTTFELAHQVFGHALSPAELEQTYGQPGKVPAWQRPEVDAWLDAHLGSAEYLFTMPPIQGAADTVQELSNTHALVCYITSRYHFMRAMTLEWLNLHSFPAAEVITRSHDVKDRNWKLKTLQKRFKSPPILIDDAIGDLDEQDVQLFAESLIWYNPLQRKASFSQPVTTVKNWQDVKQLLM